MQRKLALVVLAVFMLVMVVGCGGSKSAGTGGGSQEVIKVGFLGALTGDVANYGQPGLKGLKMAADELNAKGGILGKKVEIVEADNRGDATEAANITKKFITRDRVSAIIGDPCTGITKVAANIAQSQKMVLISPGASGEGVCAVGDYIFRNVTLDEVAAPTVADYVVNKLGKKNVAIITAINDSYSVGLTKYFKDGFTKAGAQIVGEESIQKGDTDFSAQVTKLKAKNPDIFVFTGYYTEAALFMQEAAKQGMKIPFVGGDGCLGADLYKLGGAAVEGSMVYCGFSPEGATAETQKFLDDYKVKYKQDADMFSAQYYDALMIVAQAMERAKSTDPKVYRAEMAKTKDFPGVSGVTTFRENREPIKSLVYLLTVKDSSFKLLDKIPVKL
ncbi:MAG: ABC transporter substrate-binding protein [Methylocystaceae bacterium]